MADYLSCPKCNGAITPVDTTPATCNGCHGVWLSTADYGAALENVGGVTALVQSLTQESQPTGFTCPGCRHPLQAAWHRGTEIDWCEACHGIYLDRGESDRAMVLSSSRLKKVPSPSVVEEVVAEFGAWMVMDLLFQVIGVIVTGIAEVVDVD